MIMGWPAPLAAQGAGFLIQDAGWGWGPASMARPYSKDLRDRVVGSVAGGRSCRATAALFGVSVASVVKWSQRYRATGSAAAYRMGGRRPRRLTGERDWLLARIAEKPDLTLRAVVAELAARGLAASYGAVWRFFAREGITFKKKPARRRARPRRRRPPAGPVEEISEPARSQAPGVHRRDLGQDQHDPPSRTLRPRCAAGRQGAVWPLAYADLPGRIALRSD